MSGPNQPGGPVSLRPLTALAAFSGLNLLNYLDRQVLPAVLPPLQRELHLTDTQAGWLPTAFMVGYFVTAPVFGYLGDRRSRKGLICAGVAVWSLGTVLSGWAGGLIELLLFRVLVGFGESSYGTLSPAWIADLYAPARRAGMLALFYVAIPVGSALGQILGGRVAAVAGWRAAFFWAGAPGLALALGVLWLREPKRGASEAGAGESEPGTGFKEFDAAPLGAEVGAIRTGSGSVDLGSSGPRARLEPRRSGGSWRQLSRHRDYILVVAGYVAQTFALGGFALWSATFLVRVHGLDLRAADDFFGASLVVTGLVATLAGGAAATAWNRRSRSGSAWVLGLSAALAVPAAAGAFAFRELHSAEGAMIAAMFLIFLSTGPVNALILDSVPVALRASAMAASIFAIHLLGDFWSPQLVGRLSDRFGDLRIALLWTMPPALAVCAGCWLWLAIRPNISTSSDEPRPIRRA
jgi:MFS family permease